MKKYLIAAAIATAPMLASTSAHAITVDPGSQLTITVVGNYSVQGGGNLNVGSTLNLSNVITFDINQTIPSGIDLDGLSTFTPVGVSGPITLQDGFGNDGLTFTFATNDSATFTMDQSFGASAVTTGTGSTSMFGLGELTNGGTPEDGSFSWATTARNTTGSFSLSFAVPPAIEAPDPISPIPLPAAGWALLAALGSLLAFRRYSKA